MMNTLTDPRFIFTLIAPVTFQGVTFSCLRVEIIDGVAGFANGYRFRPVRDTRAEGEPQPVWTEIGGEYFAADATPLEERALAVIEAFLATPILPPAKTIEQIWEEKLAGTITVTGPGGALQLKAAISACNRFSSMETLLKSGLERGAITDASDVSLWDASNHEHVMTVAQCRGVLFSYGYQWMAMFNEFAP